MVKRKPSKKLLKNGTCWECYSQAKPTYKTMNAPANYVYSTGWQCSCGRWWPVMEDDLFNWARAVQFTRMEKGNE